MPRGAEGLNPNHPCSVFHQGDEVTLLEVAQAASAPPEVWDIKAGKKHSPQLVVVVLHWVVGEPSQLLLA